VAKGFVNGKWFSIIVSAPLSLVAVPLRPVESSRRLLCILVLTPRQEQAEKLQARGSNVDGPTVVVVVEEETASDSTTVVAGGTSVSRER
jgi:hypothetical protein